MQNYTRSVGVIATILLSLPYLSLGAYEISDGSILQLYHFNEDLVDSSGNGYSMTGTNITYETSTLNFKADCNGSDSEADSTDSGELSNGARTIGFWIKADATGADQTFIGNRTDNTTWWRIFSKDANELYLEMGNSYPANYKLSTSPTFDWSDGNKHFIVVRTNGNNIYWYFDDGTTSSTDSWTAFSTDSSDKYTLVCASGHSGYTNFYNGDIDEAFIANEFYSTSTLIDLYEGGEGVEICVTIGCADETETSTASSTTMTEFESFLSYTIIMAIIMCVSYLTYLLLKP